jgi:hypothetical protein
VTDAGASATDGGTSAMDDADAHDAGSVIARDGGLLAAGDAEASTLRGTTCACRAGVPSGRDRAWALVALALSLAAAWRKTARAR